MIAESLPINLYREVTGSNSSEFIVFRKGDIHFYEKDLIFSCERGLCRAPDFCVADSSTDARAGQ